MTTSFFKVFKIIEPAHNHIEELCVVGLEFNLYPAISFLS